MKLSVCSIMKDEFFYAPMMIESALSFADEIIIVVDVAKDTNFYAFLLKKYEGSNKIVIIEKPYDLEFGQARQAAHDAATGDWLFFLDADEVLHENDIKFVKEAITVAEEKGVEGMHVQYLHFIENFSKIDNSVPVHIGLNRIYKKLPHVKYVNKNHSLPTLNPAKFFSALGIVIYHMGYLRGMEKIKITFERNYAFSEMHTPFYIAQWRDWHYFGNYPTKPFTGTIPKVIQTYFRMDVFK